MYIYFSLVNFKMCLRMAFASKPDQMYTTTTKSNHIDDNLDGDENYENDDDDNSDNDDDMRGRIALHIQSGFPV